MPVVGALLRWDLWPSFFYDDCAILDCVPAAMPASTDELRALLHLLDDPDPTVQGSVQERLAHLGRDALPGLRALRDTVPAEQRSTVDDLIHTLHLRDVETAWHATLNANPVHLERGAFLLALYRFPQLDIAAYQEQLDHWADEVRPAVEAATGAQRALVVSEFMADTLEFTGNRDHYYDPNNSYLNRVIDRRTGIPISLSVVLLLLARRLDLPLCGVNMPAHFLVKYAGPGGELYLDPFNDGAVVQKDDCVRFLLKAGVRAHPRFLACASATDTLLRMGRNLLAIARESDQKQTGAELARLLGPHDPSVEVEND